MKAYPRAGNLYMFQGRRYLGGVPYVEKNWKRGRSNLRWHYGGRTFWGWRVEERSGPRGCHDFYTGRDSEGILETIDDDQKAN